MVIKKTKESKGARTLPITGVDWALSKNNGESVKYRIRKQEEREHEQLIEEFFDEGEDLIGGREAEVPGCD